MDEERQNVLDKIVKTKKGVVKQLSDHNPIITKFNLKWSRRVSSWKNYSKGDKKSRISMMMKVGKNWMKLRTS